MQTGEPVKCLGGAKHSSSNILKSKMMCRGWEETTFRGTSTWSHTGKGMLLIVSLSPKTFSVTASYNLLSKGLWRGWRRRSDCLICGRALKGTEQNTRESLNSPNLLSEFHISFSWREEECKKFPSVPLGSIASCFRLSDIILTNECAY